MISGADSLWSGFAAPPAATHGVRKAIGGGSTPEGPAQTPQAVSPVIVARNLFGTTDVETSGAGKGVGDGNAVDNMVKTSLQLELIGTVSGNGPYNYAVIFDQDQKRARIFKVGEQLGSAKITRVLRRSVVLSINGREEILTMKSQRPLAGRGMSAPGRSSAPPPSIENVKDLLSPLAQARPHFEGGKMDGYYLGSVEEGSFFRRIGLQSGDIVEAVNNQVFSKPDDINQLQEMNFTPGKKNTIRVKRQGRSLTLNLD